jgi:hypothetical protein
MPKAPLAGQVFPIPKDRENESDAWKRAFQHAKQWRNPDKSSALFADSHAHAFESVDEDADA